MPQLRLRGGEVDGLALNYLVEGRGPAVVLVHGLGGFAESWRHNIGSLAARATVYAIDLPGFGRSAKPRAAYSLAFFARTLHAFLDGVGVTHASLVGHSLGAAVAVTYALTRPARSEEHTSELQSHSDLVCRLLLEKKKKNKEQLDRGTRTLKPTPELTTLAETPKTQKNVTALGR